MRSATVSFESAAVEEKSGRFGDLGFLIRFPIVAARNGRLLIALPGAGGRAAGLDTFAWPQITEGSAYAAIDSSDQARPKSVRQIADGLIPEGRVAVPAVLLQGSGAHALPPHSRAAVQRASA